MDKLKTNKVVDTFLVSHCGIISWSFLKVTKSDVITALRHSIEEMVQSGYFEGLIRGGLCLSLSQLT